MFLSLLFLPFFTITSLAGDPFNLRRGHIQQYHRRANTTTTFELKDLYQGENFFDQWNFFSSPDPTHGSVNYQTRANAIKKNLAFVDQGGATVLAVDDFSTVPVGGKRDSVRISTKKTYDHGLFIADFQAMPHGCSLWPAYWTVGPNWPSAGEVDIVEGVHEGSNNIYVVHTSPSCQIKQSFSSNEVTSNLMNHVCTSSGKDNRGCGFSDPDDKSYGSKFNQGGGGVFAHLWDSSGIKIYRFPRNAIPSDIESKQPNPASWGTPAALFENSDGCDFSSHFFQHSIVLDMTICGDFAGPTYQGAGCPGTCKEAVANPTNFKTAKWKINYIAVYNS